MVSRADIQSQITAGNQEVQNLDIERQATIAQQRDPETGNIDVNRRRAINSDFQRRSELVRARVRSLQKAQQQIGTGSVSESSLAAFIREGQRLEVRAFRVSERQDVERRIARERETIQQQISKPITPQVQREGRITFSTSATQEQFFPGATSPFEDKPLFFRETRTGDIIVVGKKERLRERRELERETLFEQPIFQTPLTLDIGARREPPIQISPELILEDVTPMKAIIPEPTPFEETLPQVFELTPPTRIEKLREKAFTESTKGEFSLLGQLGGFGAGVSTSVISTGRFAKQIVQQPVETIGRTLEGITRLPEALGGVGRILEQEGAFALGFVTTELAILKAPTLIQKGVDIFRTRGLRQLPTEQIVAPEFFAGQTFPTIRRGQTAGELLGEFKPLLPGELRPAGFTASARPIGELVIRRGTSELPGLFQAPKVSPRFLRVGGESQKLISLDLFGQTLRPSLFRITPQDFSLVPGLKSTTKIIQPGKIKGVQQFFETAPKGRSFIPFIKTEKEAIIPFGTILKPTAKRFFIKFEGRRIPIFEFEALGGKGVKGVTGLPKASDIARSLGSSRIGRTGAVSPFELLISSSAIERQIGSSIISPVSSRRLISDVSLRGFLPSSKDIISSITRRPRRVREIGDIRSLISTPRRSVVSDISSITSRPSRARAIPIIPSVVIPGITEEPIRRRKPKKKKVKKKEKKKRRKTPIKPSLTGIARFQFGGITGALPKEVRGLGILPGRIRFVPG